MFALPKKGKKNNNPEILREEFLIVRLIHCRLICWGVEVSQRRLLGTVSLLRRLTFASALADSNI